MRYKLLTLLTVSHLIGSVFGADSPVESVETGEVGRFSPARQGGDFAPYEFRFQSSTVTMIPVTANGRVPDFWMSATEITWEQYLEWAFNSVQDKDDAFDKNFRSPLVQGDIGWDRVNGNEKKPVFGMPPYAATRFCEWISTKSGDFYRLPTAWEWDTAYELGETSRRKDGTFRQSQTDWDEVGFFLWRDVVPRLPREIETLRILAPGKSRAPNKLGIYDMEGNVAEWTISSMDFGTGQMLQLGSPGPSFAGTLSLLPRRPQGWITKGSSSFSDFGSFSPERVGTPLNRRLVVTSSESFGWMTEPDKETLMNGIRLVRPRIAPPQSEWIRYWKCELNNDFRGLFWLDLMIERSQGRVGWNLEDWFFIQDFYKLPARR